MMSSADHEKTMKQAKPKLPGKRRGKPLVLLLLAACLSTGTQAQSPDVAQLDRARDAGRAQLLHPATGALAIGIYSREHPAFQM